MNNVSTLMDVVAVLNRLPTNDIQALADGLVWFDDATADRLKNAISYSQQEKDKTFMARWDREQLAKEYADQDAQHYGASV